jgi:hypothetical protein
VGEIRADDGQGNQCRDANMRHPMSHELSPS